MPVAGGGFHCASACTGDGDCPEGFVCRTSLGICLSVGDPDQTPPALVGPVAIEPDVGTVGTFFQVRFVVDERQGAVPQVGVDVGTRVAPLALDEAHSDPANKA